MGQFLQVNGDYNIKTAEGASIILDTGPALSGGNVRVVGNLIVEGETVSVAVNNLNVEDNILIINYYADRDNLPSGVTLDYAGIEIDRGILSPAVFLYEESSDSWIIANNSAPGPFNFSEGNLKLRKILTDSATDDGDLILIGTGTGVIKVFGTEAYEDQVTHDDDIPNKKYVDDRILSNPTFQIVAPQDQDTKVIITDKDIFPNDPTESGSLAYFEDVTNETTNGESAVSVIVDTTLVAQFYNNRLEVGNLEFGSGVQKNQITSNTSASGDNIYIKTLGGGRLQTNAALQLEKISSAGAFVPNSVILYANTPSSGESGVWFLNDSADITKRNGELISKSKALVFSMLF
jgi:hypothetical protein